MKKVISLILCVLMLGSCFAFADTIEGSRTVIGADLDADEVASVTLSHFALSKSGVSSTFSVAAEVFVRAYHTPSDLESTYSSALIVVVRPSKYRSVSFRYV